MVDLGKVVEALTAYRAYLIKRGQPLKAATVGHCIKLIRRLAS